MTFYVFCFIIFIFNFLIYLPKFTSAEQCGYEFAEAVLARHNYYRTEVHRPTPPLILNETLSDIAQQWAEKILITGVYRHRPDRKLSENLYREVSEVGPSLTVLPVAKEAVDAWYMESRFYKPYYGLEPDLSTFSFWRYFTALIWVSSRQMGVGCASGVDPQDPRRRITYVVTNYSPRGNVINNFRKNVLPPKGKKKEAFYESSTSYLTSYGTSTPPTTIYYPTTTLSTTLLTTPSTTPSTTPYTTTPSPLTSKSTYKTTYYRKPSTTTPKITTEYLKYFSTTTPTTPSTTIYTTTPLTTIYTTTPTTIYTTTPTTTTYTAPHKTYKTTILTTNYPTTASTTTPVYSTKIYLTTQTPTTTPYTPVPTTTPVYTTNYPSSYSTTLLPSTTEIYQESPKPTSYKPPAGYPYFLPQYPYGIPSNYYQQNHYPQYYPQNPYSYVHYSRPRPPVRPSSSIFSGEDLIDLQEAANLRPPQPIYRPLNHFAYNNLKDLNFYNKGENQQAGSKPEVSKPEVLLNYDHKDVYNLFTSNYDHQLNYTTSSDYSTTTTKKPTFYVPTNYHPRPNLPFPFQPLPMPFLNQFTNFHSFNNHQQFQKPEIELPSPQKPPFFRPSFYRPIFKPVVVYKHQKNKDKAVENVSNNNNIKEDEKEEEVVGIKEQRN